jgi:threonine/homoserine/homoserine lactone efflux protein
VEQILALVGFAFVSSVTPGPNNLLLWASGARFGFARTLPHVVGTAVGIGAMALAVAAGLGAVIATIPQLAFGLKVASTVYLLYLAWLVGRASAIEEVEVARPFTLLQAAAFQVLNPKAWVFAIGAMTTFRPPDLAIGLGSLLVVGIMVAVTIPTAALWAAAGGALSRLVADARARRMIGFAMAAVLILTVVSVWV